jgi:hypothetical protein
MPTADADPPPRAAARDRALLSVREFHDRGALWLFEDPRQLRELIQILEPALTEMLDFSRARRENRSFIPADLQKQESDLRMGRSILEQAEARGEARALVRLLAARFGPVPAEIERAVAEADPERLDGWIERAAKVATLAEVGIK